MKTLALIITLALHATGLWGYLSPHTRANITSTATTGDPIAPAKPAPAPPATALPALPIRTTTNTLGLSATSAFAVDSDTGTVLFAQNAATRLPLASITKLVTTLVVLSRHNPKDLVKIPHLPDYAQEDELIGLIQGETYTVGDLVHGALINSGNDAADALALYDSGSTTKFAAAMNAKMNEWGITNTHFSNPSGLQDTGNYTSAEALAKIAQLALASPFIRQTVAQSTATITSTAGRSLNLVTTDDLLASGQFYGIKTGYTLAAGECFVGVTRIAGHEVVTVVLNATDRFGVTQDLTNWIGLNWQWL